MVNGVAEERSKEKGRFEGGWEGGEGGQKKGEESREGQQKRSGKKVGGVHTKAGVNKRVERSTKREGQTAEGREGITTQTGEEGHFCRLLSVVVGKVAGATTRQATLRERDSSANFASSLEMQRGHDLFHEFFTLVVCNSVSTDPSHEQFSPECRQGSRVPPSTRKPGPQLRLNYFDCST